MKDLISWIILITSAIGAVYAIGVIVTYLLLGRKDDEDDCICPVCSELNK